eukprot:CAMPEP_0119032306 /NCGR_PEP_ID=MMETSP1176-20130426/41985_1 /TAXON_ID=265551 /ORGANISM="Synedropsis recta cf, Strain CCMP1620" /LENGTH=737 /DNA_ID=CAMNT_0006988717 /DNA_START=87 /DNA_END=2300 /DNA_ORIENTATION=-
MIDNRRRRKRPVAPERPQYAPPIDYGNRHPFGEKRKRRGRRQLVEERPLDFEPIRIIFDTSILEAFLRAKANQQSDILEATRAFLLLYEILPKTAKLLSDVITVVPVQGAIYPLSPHDKPDNYEVFCPTDKTSGIEGDGDLLIFVTLDRFFCGNSNSGGAFSTAASAVSCERDQYDRPVTGSIDFCLDAIGTVSPINDLNGLIESINKNSTASSLDDINTAAVDRTLEVATHELLHVLGLTSDSLPFFRNPLTGKPLTPRPFRLTETTCSNGESTAVLGEPSEQVLGRETDPTTGALHFEVRTPLVVQVARNHFNCPSLTGARLENQPTSSDCYGSHWEERLYYSELMSAFLSTANNALSPLTLAFLEDSSWYRARYQSEYVKTSSFGHLAGCDFVNKDCIVDGQVPKYGEGNFCSSTLELSQEGFVVRQAFPQTCDPTYTYKAHCDLRVAGTNDEVSEASSRYFPNEQVKIPHEFTNADFCPIPSLQAVSCKSKRDEFIVSREYADARERNGPDSICVDVTTRDRAICLESACNTAIGRLQMKVLYGLTITCQFDGQIHTLLGSSGFSNGLPFQIRCPKLSQVCPDLLCPDNCSGRGVCNYDTELESGRCECFDKKDNSTGCYNSTLARTYTRLSIGTDGESKGANLLVFLLVVGGVVFGLVGLHIWTRLKNDGTRRADKLDYETVQPTKDVDAEAPESFRDEENRSPEGHRTIERFHHDHEDQDGFEGVQRHSHH